MQRSLDFHKTFQLATALLAVLLFEEMDVVKAFSCFSVLFFEPILIAYSVYPDVVVVYLVSCFLVPESFAFLKILAKITIPQAFFSAAGF